MRTPEVPYDEEADQRRREAERREELLRERQALLEREAQVARRELEAARRIAEAERRAAEALERSTQLLDEALEDRYDDTIRYGYYYYPGYPYKRHLHYYRRDGNIYYQRPKHPPHRSWTREPPVRVRKQQAGQFKDGAAR
jgi:hypothetical protein